MNRLKIIQDGHKMLEETREFLLGKVITTDLGDFTIKHCRFGKNSLLFIAFEAPCLDEDEALGVEVEYDSGITLRNIGGLTGNIETVVATLTQLKVGLQLLLT